MNNTINEKIKAFTDLNAWKKGHELVINIYTITRLFPREEIYSLTDQMRRATTSVTSNIAEGFSRQTHKEKAQFYHLAQGSLTELINQLIIAKDVGYLEKIVYTKLSEQAELTHKILHGLIKSSKSKIIQKP